MDGISGHEKQKGETMTRFEMRKGPGEQGLLICTVHNGERGLARAIFDFIRKERPDKCHDLELHEVDVEMFDFDNDLEDYREGKKQMIAKSNYTLIGTPLQSEEEETSGR